LTLVVDASVAVEYLLRTPLGQKAAPTLEAAALAAPELLDAEVLAVLRRAVLGRRLSEPRARAALHDLAAWDVRRLPHAPLLLVAWAMRRNVSAYDAMYVAAARLLGATVLTADGPLSRAPSTGVAIQNVRI
jgi:predicted nucleic acid-binding protein